MSRGNQSPQSGSPSQSLTLWTGIAGAWEIPRSQPVAGRPGRTSDNLCRTPPAS